MRDWVDFEEDVGADGWGFSDLGAEPELTAEEKRIAANVAQATADVKTAFRAFERQGVSGQALRTWLLSGLQTQIDNAIDLYRLNPLARGAKAARDDAYALRYELNERSELKVQANVPEWLLTQLRNRVLAFLEHASAAGMKAESVFVQAARVTGEGAAAIPQAVRDSIWDSIPLGVKIAGGALIVIAGFAVYAVLKTAGPVAVSYVKRRAGLQGIGEIRESRRGRTIVCFKARKSRRNRKREEVCFPARHAR